MGGIDAIRVQKRADIGAIAELLLGVKAERRRLEGIAKPLTAA